MKSAFKLFSILIAVQLLFTSSTLAIQIKDRSEYLIDTRGDDGDICLNRLSLHKKLDSPEIEISLFGEAQWNLDISEWEKIISGIEVTSPLYKYLYIGQSIQYISGEILDYMVFDADSYTFDTTTKIGLHIPLSKQFSFCIAEEYTFNLEKGRDEYCETLAEVFYELTKTYSFGIGWRHTDRIHNLDTDYVSISLTLNF